MNLFLEIAINKQIYWGKNILNFLYRISEKKKFSNLVRNNYYLKNMTLPQ